MEAVFLGGSRRIVRLNESIRSKLDEFMERGLWIFVGDANGADRALQQHLASRGYERVIVYAVTGMLRNNVGPWKVRFVDAPRGARGFELYSLKDKQMAKDAAYGFMLWDRKSRGTLENVFTLLSHGKPVAVHLGPGRGFVSLKSPEDLHKLGIGAGLPRQGDFHFGSPTDATQHAVAADGRGSADLHSPPLKKRRKASARGRS